MNNGIHVAFSILISSGYMPRSGIAGSYGHFLSSFLRNLHTFFHLAVSVYIPTNSARVLPFSTPSPAVIVCRLFDDAYSDWGDMTAH